MIKQATKKKFIFSMIILCFSSNLKAQYFRPKSLDTVVKKAAYIFEGTIIKDSCFWGSDSVIYTAHWLQVSKILKGDVHCGQVEIITDGGGINGYINIAPETVKLRSGEKGIFMCVNTITPYITPPGENPNAMMLYYDVSGLIAYYTPPASEKVYYYWTTKQLPDLPYIYTLISSYTGYTYSTCPETSAPVKKTLIH